MRVLLQAQEVLVGLIWVAPCAVSFLGSKVLPLLHVLVRWLPRTHLKSSRLLALQVQAEMASCAQTVSLLVHYTLGLFFWQAQAAQPLCTCSLPKKGGNSQNSYLWTRLHQLGALWWS